MIKNILNLGCISNVLFLRTKRVDIFDILLYIAIYYLHPCRFCVFHTQTILKYTLFKEGPVEYSVLSGSQTRREDS